MLEIPSFSIGPVRERDTTLLLLEECCASTNFRQWLVEQLLPPHLSLSTIVRACCSVVESNGESDLEIGFTCGQREIWLLIENKIAASFQDTQVDRYHERGRLYVEQGKCAEFYTVLIAPERYFGAPHALKGFDKRLTYESLRDWFLTHHEPSPRRSYKVRLLDASIHKASTRNPLTPDKAVSKFWHAYWELATKEAPELRLQAPGDRGNRSGFIYFRPVALPKRVQLIHKMPRECTLGNVDLQFDGMGERFGDFTRTFASCLEPGMIPVQAGKSGVIRIVVPALDPHADFSPQAENALAGLRAAKRLTEWLQKQQSLINACMTTWKFTKRRDRVIEQVVLSSL